MFTDNNLGSLNPRVLKNSNQYQSTFGFAKVASTILWLLFFANLAFIVFNSTEALKFEYRNVIRTNGFTFLIWTVVTFFSAIISTYATNYVKGFRYYNRFLLLCVAFTVSVMLLVVSNHIVLLLGSWLLMGFFMARLIGVDKDWTEAKAAANYAQRFFFIGWLCLSLGVLLPAFTLDIFTLESIILSWNNLPLYITLISSIGVIVAAMIQSAIYPFHRWLLSAMTSPTPASALMHAGFVNGSGILLTLFATLIVASNTFDILFIIGGLTAILAQFTKLLQVNVKQKLACSTIAQMGFMIMQCGLGFFNAAIVHLILHGFYKAYLFLSSGEEIKQTVPQKELDLKIKPLQALLVLVFGTLGAFLFTTLTGKGMELDSSIFLTLIVAITVGQITYNIVKQKSLSMIQKLVWPPLLFIVGIVIYALMYNGITILMHDTPMAVVAIPVTPFEIGFGIVFLIGFFIMKLGFYRRIPWLYVKLLNISQPFKKSVLTYTKSN
ncbi:proton-conducting transporter transmembrane domain-containing protein [Winogradskyella sp.]|uniref:proton-conducting transporter transmembrane domain-containing protein n=1 Tax=Winogradskyella sp. TaxID=1883156 RepID=UPI003F6D9B59